SEPRGGVVDKPAEPKSQLYLAALPLLTAHRADLLDLPALRAQLTSLERRRRAGGRDIVDHLPGAHDDVANAVCGALVLAAANVAGDSAPVVSRHVDRAGNVIPTLREEAVRDGLLSDLALDPWERSPSGRRAGRGEVWGGVGAPSFPLGGRRPDW